jgi:hypothetical protein
MTRLEKLKTIAEKYGTEIKEPIEIGSTGYADQFPSYVVNTYGYDKNGRFVYILPVLSVKEVCNSGEEREEKSWNTLFQRYVGNEDVITAGCNNNIPYLVSAAWEFELENLEKILEGETIEDKRLLSIVYFSL